MMYLLSNEIIDHLNSSYNHKDIAPVMPRHLTHMRSPNSPVLANLKKSDARKPWPPLYQFCHLFHSVEFRDIPLHNPIPLTDPGINFSGQDLHNIICGLGWTAFAGEEHMVHRLQF